MMQLRKWFLAAMTALVLAAPVVTAPPARADSTPVAGETRWYHVYAREDPDSPWYEVGAYDNYNDARTVADFLKDLGYEAFIR